MIKISVIIQKKEWLKYITNPQAYLKKKIKILNKKNNFFKNKKIELSLLLSGKKEIKILNKKFRKKNKPTDVLSFPSYEKKELQKEISKKRNVYLGDIVISLDKVEGDPKSRDFINDFNRLWIHGFVHLFGYKHKKYRDFLKMEKLEKKFLHIIS